MDKSIFLGALVNGLYKFKGQWCFTFRKSVLPKQRFREKVLLYIRETIGP